MKKLRYKDLKDPPTYDSIRNNRRNQNNKETSSNKISSLKKHIRKIKKKTLKIVSYDWEKIIYSSSFILIIIFLVISFSPFLIGDNDNSTYLCTQGAPGCINTSDCDITAYGQSGDCQDCTYWNVGGSGDSQGYPIGGATLCCGDDAFEYYRNRVGGIDAPTDYTSSSSDQACCAADTRCVIGGTCVSSASTHGTIPTKAYCDSGTWIGGDASSAACTEIVGTDNWAIGGEVSPSSCCGDDENEYKLSRISDSAVMESFETDPDDKACCSEANKCVANGICTSSGNSISDIDGDGDDDYCLEGTWVDCNDDSHCNYGYICYISENNCVNVNGGIIIRNLGTTGIEETNQEYTSIRNVMLSLNYTEEAIQCRYTNYPIHTETPPEDYSGWTLWESCISNRVWILSENSGLKTVFYQIGYTVGSSIFNDTIYYDFTGEGLDLTPPTPPIVYHKNFTNDNQNITIYWYNATDPESEILGIPLIYNVSLFNENHLLLANARTTSQSYTFDVIEGLRVAHGTRMYANVTVINSANLKSSAISNYLVYDNIGPDIIALFGEIYNISKQEYMFISDEDDWFYANKANISWDAFDTNSSIYGYSYILNKDSLIQADDIPEGSPGSFHEKIYNEFTSLASGKYYFAVKARDLAGNWGPVSSIAFSIDNTPPTDFRILSQTQTAENITFTWSESFDPESDIAYYNATLLDRNDKINQTQILDKNTREWTFENLISQDYTVIVYAYNQAGLWRSTGDTQMSLDITPPVITAMPNATLITNFPILKVWTDEQAVCYYNSSNDLVRFRYSNTTYHETKLNYHAYGNHNYIITCKDLFENKADETISLTIENTNPFNILSEDSLSAYENTKKTIRFKVVDSENNELSGLLQSNFNFKLNNRNYPFSVFDIGDGYFDISFETPDHGPYNIKIEIEYAGSKIEKDITLTVEKLRFNLIYIDPEISDSVPESHISYFTSNTKIGIATDYNLELSNDITSQNNKLNISGIRTNNYIMIFNTRPDASMSDRNKKISKDEFMGFTNPSFGYLMTKEHYITYKILYDNYLIQGEEILNTGKHDILITYTIEDNQQIIRFQKSSGKNRIVLVSG